MARQAELDELRKEIEDLKKNNPVSGLTDPLADPLAQVQADVQAELDRPVEAPAQTVQPAEQALDTGPEPRSGEFQVTEQDPGAATEHRPIPS
jgi:sec-independent protein translocase protein TatB